MCTGFLGAVSHKSSAEREKKTNFKPTYYKGEEGTHLSANFPPFSTVGTVPLETPQRNLTALQIQFKRTGTEPKIGVLEFAIYASARPAHLYTYEQDNGVQALFFSQTVCDPLIRVQPQQFWNKLLLIHAQVNEFKD